MEPTPDADAPGRVASVLSGLRRVDPVRFRPGERPDGFLYWVTSGERAERLLRAGVSRSPDPLADLDAELVERGEVPRRLQALANELGWDDDVPAQALAVLRLHRHAFEGASSGHRASPR